MSAPWPGGDGEEALAGTAQLLAVPRSPRGSEKGRTSDRLHHDAKVLGADPEGQVTFAVDVELTAVAQSTWSRV